MIEVMDDMDKAWPSETDVLAEMTDDGLETLLDVLEQMAVMPGTSLWASRQFFCVVAEQKRRQACRPHLITDEN
ncbi:hypothetical protein LH935_28515 (plasmid) [Gordonia polyisoprenivorans]|uniref:hypothetical protein n=1 Tax=Gordonia polyisoprenivorans TaxID=84595 RepID=UPI0022341D69|nr:hypothetical protein LH935_28515 [Gordonia polyisoprenivorans]